MHCSFRKLFFFGSVRFDKWCGFKAVIRERREGGGAVGGASQRHRALRCVLPETSACLGSRLREESLLNHHKSWQGSPALARDWRQPTPSRPGYIFRVRYLVATHQRKVPAALKPTGSIPPPLSASCLDYLLPWAGRLLLWAFAHLAQRGKKCILGWVSICLS